MKPLSSKNKEIFHLLWFKKYCSLHHLSLGLQLSNMGKSLRPDYPRLSNTVCATIFGGVLGRKKILAAEARTNSGIPFKLFIHADHWQFVSHNFHEVHKLSSCMPTVWTFQAPNVYDSAGEDWVNHYDNIGALTMPAPAMTNHTVDHPLCNTVLNLPAQITKSSPKASQRQIKLPTRGGWLVMELCWPGRRKRTSQQWWYSPSQTGNGTVECLVSHLLHYSRKAVHSIDHRTKRYYDLDRCLPKLRRGFSKTAVLPHERQTFQKCEKVQDKSVPPKNISIKKISFHPLGSPETSARKEHYINRKELR